MALQLPVSPDFILVGAMKSGTTSLHHALASHPQIFIPRGEIHLFTIDDIEQYPQGSGSGNGGWIYQNFYAFFPEYARWYQDLFANAAPGQLLGEDSTTYLSSKIAMDRIAAHLPNTKLLVMLRDPVERLYSHYWQWVRTYRAIYSLEDTIRFQHGNLVQRSLYEEQLRYCFARVDRERVKVVVFEEFVADQKPVLDSVLRYLGIAGASENMLRRQHSNRGTVPRSLQLALWKNRLLRDLYGRQYRGRAPRLPAAERLPSATRAALAFFRLINPEHGHQPPPMKAETREFLSRFLLDRNAGLPDLLGMDLARYWPTFRR